MLLGDRYLWRAELMPAGFSGVSPDSLGMSGGRRIKCLGFLAWFDLCVGFI